MKVAIVILNWNGRSMMEQYLPSVLKFSRNEAEIIIADNASTDDSVAWLKATYPYLRVIELTENYGFAEGYNRALKQVDSEYYVLLNSDVEVTHHWLTPLIEEMDAHEDIAACQPKLPLCGQSLTLLSMPEHRVASLIVTVIRSAEGASLTRWRTIMGSMITVRKYFGQQVLA